MIRRWRIQRPIEIERGLPPCRCGADADDGRHLPVRECWPGGEEDCPDPAAHHAYRARPLWQRRDQNPWGWL